jgi:predicted homoserine dehydrogenase-like protein
VQWRLSGGRAGAQDLAHVGDVVDLQAQLTKLGVIDDVQSAAVGGGRFVITEARRADSASRFP